MENGQAILSFFRRIASGIIACLVLLSTALAEPDIVFRDIPWLSNETTVIKMLKKQGVITDDTDLKHARRECVQLWEPFAGCEYSNDEPVKLNGTLGYARVPQISYFFRGKYSALKRENEPICQVAGHDVHIIRVFFLPKVKNKKGIKTYDFSDAALVRAGYNFSQLYYGEAEKVYLDLQSKLSSLYGSPTEINEKSWEGTYWRSSDGIGIRLWQFDDSVYIDYAYLNDEKIVSELSDIQHAIDEDACNSTDGL